MVGNLEFGLSESISPRSNAAKICQVHTYVRSSPAMWSITEQPEDSHSIPHCSMATLIGLSIRVRMLRALPERFKVDIRVKAGSHQSEHQVNRQLNDKERVAGQSTLLPYFGFVLRSTYSGIGEYSSAGSGPELFGYCWRKRRSDDRALRALKSLGIHSWHASSLYSRAAPSVHTVYHLTARTQKSPRRSDCIPV